MADAGVVEDTEAVGTSWATFAEVGATASAVARALTEAELALSSSSTRASRSREVDGSSAHGFFVTMMRKAVATIAPTAPLAAATQVNRRRCSFGMGGGGPVVVSVTDVTCEAIPSAPDCGSNLGDAGGTLIRPSPVMCSEGRNNGTVRSR